MHQRFSEDEVKTGTEEEDELIIIERIILLVALLEEHDLYIYLYSILNQKADPSNPNPNSILTTTT